MTDTRKSRAKKNIVVSLASQVIVLLCGIVVPRAMLGAFGSEAYGATTSIAQFLSYIALLEGGIGGVARAALYGPIAAKDNRTIGAILAEIKRFFNVIACIFAAYVLVLACSFQSLSRIECMDWLSTCLLVIIISISSFGQYFIGITYSVFLQADQKSYITNGVSTVTTIINAISTVLLVQVGCSMLVVKLASSCIFFMRPVVLWLYVKKKYAIQIEKPKHKQGYLTQKWSGLGQHIAYFLHSNTDTVILTLLANLRDVAVYSVYHMIVSHIKNLALSFTSGMEAVFGDMLARKEITQLRGSIRMYETVISVVAVTLFATMTVLIVPFVKIYTAGIEDANYIVPVFAILLILSELCYCLRTPYHSLVIAAGHFKQTSIAAYGEAAINVGLSIILVIKLGLVGVAIGTLAATVFRFVFYVVYLKKYILQLKIRTFLKRVALNAIAFFASCVAGEGIVSFVCADDYLRWCVCGVLVFATAGLITLAVNYILEKNEFKLVLSKIIKTK